MKKLSILLLISFFTCGSLMAQYSPSPFGHLKRPIEKEKISLNPTATSITQNAFRFSAVSGYEFGTNQIVAGLCYGYQSLTLDTAGNWYENFGIGLVAFGGGSTTTGFNLATVFSAGININALNGLVSVSPVYNFSGKFGLVWSINLPLK
jgi:hypothetical protein